MSSQAVWRSLLEGHALGECETRIQDERVSNLFRYIEGRARDLAGDDFEELLRSFIDFVRSTIERQPDDAVSAIRAIEELASEKQVFGEEALKGFVRLLREVLESQRTRHPQLLQATVKAMGKIIASGGGLMSHIVEEQARWAVHWLSSPGNDLQRTSAVLVLKSLAENAPSSFNVHVNTFLQHIWEGLHGGDPKLRMASAEALRACLQLFERRETRNRVQWYHKLAQRAIHELSMHRSRSTERVHGSLLVLRELLTHSGEFMLARYEEVVERALMFKHHVDPHVRLVVLSIIPHLAYFCPERFVPEHFKCCMENLIQMLKPQNWQSVAEVGMVFGILNDMVVALDKRSQQKHLGEWLPEIVEQVSCVIMRAAASQEAPCKEALECCGSLAEALEDEWKPHATALLLHMVSTGVSDTLATTLQKTIDAIPDLTYSIREILLDAVAMVLVGAPFRTNLPKEVVKMLKGPGQEQGCQEADEKLVVTGLSILSSFDFGQCNLLAFISKNIIKKVSISEEWTVRQAAAGACCLILKRHAEALQAEEGDEGVCAAPVPAMLQQLVQTGASDRHEDVRATVYRLLLDSPALDICLAQPGCIAQLFPGLGDCSYRVREMAIRLVGRLATKGAAVKPMLRVVLDQLLLQLELSPEHELQEDSAYLLEVLVQSAPCIVLSNTARICKTLICLLEGKLRDVSDSDKENRRVVKPAMTAKQRNAVMGNGRVLRSVLETCGCLAETATKELIEKGYMDRFLELTVECIKDASYEEKAVEAVKTLGKIVSSTGQVLVPYHRFPWLLPQLLEMLQVEDEELRKVVVKVLGVISALDPAKHRSIQATASGEGRLELEGVRPVKRGHVASEVSSMDRGRLFGWGGRSLDSCAAELMPVSGIAANSEESYSIIAMNALLRILKQPKLRVHHKDAVETLGNITNSLSISSVPYLQTLIPNWCEAIYGGDEELKVYILEQFIRLVRVVKQHIRRFLDKIMKLMEDLWVQNCPKRTLINILKLIGELAGVCQHDLRRYLDWLVPRFILVLETSEADVVITALHSLADFGCALQNRFHQILPTFSSLLLHKGSQLQLGVQQGVLYAMSKLMPQLHVPELAGELILPLIILLEGSRYRALRDRVMEAICAVGMAVGPDSNMFLCIKRVMSAHGIRNGEFEELSRRMQQVEQPWGQDEDWEAGATWRDNFEPVLPELAEELAAVSGARHRLNETDMRHAMDTAPRYTFHDWSDWMRRLSLMLLRSSPSPALRACHKFAQIIPGMAKDLFPASFISCWSELSAGEQQQLAQSLQTALASPTIPPEIVTALLNLAEFMEHDNSQLPLDTRTLGALAAKCHALAKALHYKELEFQETPETAVESILAINNQLRQPEAADGMLKYAMDVLNMEVRESWYEKLHKWEEALRQYEERTGESAPQSIAHIEASLGCMRCYHALWDWDNLANLCEADWELSDPFVRKEMAPLAAEAAWHLQRWDDMPTYLIKLDAEMETAEASTSAFLNSVYAVQTGDYATAKVALERATEGVSAALAALAGESYDRAYHHMVLVQQLTELEEVMHYKISKEEGNEERIKQIRKVWDARLPGVQCRSEVLQSLLSVRSLVLEPHEDAANWVIFAAVCRKQGREAESRIILTNLLGYDPMIRGPGEKGYGSGSTKPEIMYAFLKHMYAVSIPDRRRDICNRMRDLISELDVPEVDHKDYQQILVKGVPLISKAYVRLGKWEHALQSNTGGELDMEMLLAVMDRATDHAGTWARAWREWAAFHLIAMDHYHNEDERRASELVAPAVRGFFQALNLSQDHALRGGMLGSGPSKDAYEDILRLLTLWFTHGSAPGVVDALSKGFKTVRLETWLVVIPQIIARIHMREPHIQHLIHMLLEDIGRAHPQALLYPLLVACHSTSGGRRAAAQKVLACMREFAPELVGEAELVSRHLVEIAVLWLEKWHEALEEASRLHFAEGDSQGMIELMLPLHEMLRTRQPQTNSERAFVHNYMSQLDEAYAMLRNFETTRAQTSIECAWDNYYHVFKRVHREFHNMNVLHLSDVAPELLNRGMNVAVPGTYAPFEDEQVCIERIVPEIQVIKSKQHPRKLTIEGSDGNDYVFLLKGHEDLRQDERVMQLFGLVNTVLSSDYQASERELSIARYAVTPLSPNVGLIGWVPNCDTMHALIREYRETKGIPISMEHSMMKNFSPNYECLTLIQKVEVFEHALESTPGDDLRKIMWIKSRNSEHWLAHRTNYIRSCAVMSMVGYLLGLGDRHPSNLMIDRYTGKLLHIDFGDCFEAGMNRDKFPEKVPFRLTRMMIKAMEVSGVEGTFRKTCELVMRVLRQEKHSLMAMLQAFVFDPLINWRLALNRGDAVAAGTAGLGATGDEGSDDVDVGMGPRRDLRERDNQPGDAHEMLNSRAVQVTDRIKSKLSGRDFGTDKHESVSVEEQVDRLIIEATSHVNLCQAYIGWCPFW